VRCRSGGTTDEPADRDEILVSHRADIGYPECHESLGAAGSGHELDLWTGRCIDLNNRSKIALSETMFRKVAIENNGIELFESHRPVPGKAVTKRGAISQENSMASYRPSGQSHGTITTRMARASAVSGSPQTTKSRKRYLPGP
jgi:hypothetical protein